QNRNLREADVIYIASNRPNIPEGLHEIALHKTWFLRQSVRHTLVINPYAGTGLALKLLPTLSIDKLHQVRNATHVHPLVIETAALLVELREQRTAPWRVYAPLLLRSPLGQFVARGLDRGFEKMEIRVALLLR